MNRDVVNAPARPGWTGRTQGPNRLRKEHIPMASKMRNMTNPVASANRVAALSVLGRAALGRTYATCAASVTETTITWAHNPVPGFAKKHQRPKDPLH